jgi:hypothetical protein
MFVLYLLTPNGTYSLCGFTSAPWTTPQGNIRRQRMRKGYVWIVLMLLAVICFFAGTSSADSITVTVNGTQYDITTVTGTFTDNMAQLESTPWWDNESLAQEIAAAVMDDIGTPNDNGEIAGGPLFAWNDDAIDAFIWFQGIVYPTSPSESVSLSYGVGSAVNAPEPGSLSMLLVGLFGVGLFVVLKHLGRNARATET